MSQNWFISAKYRHPAKLALITSVLAFVVILLGAYTRLTDAGLSCPDWPHCYGYLTAPHTTSQLQSAALNYPLIPVNVKKAWTEMTHRYFAGSEGILILILSFSMFFSRKANDAKAMIIGTILIGLLTIQVTLGMLTVTEKLKPVIVLSHLLTGLSLLSVLWWAYLEIQRKSDTILASVKTTRAHRLLLWGALFVIAAQITLGGWVSTHYAGLACIDLPFCNGKLLPTMQWANVNSDLITIHMMHRIGAMITAVYLSFIAVYLFNKPTFRVIAILLFSLLTLQLTLGILNILWLRPVWLALMHHCVAILILLTIITSLVKATIMADNRHAKFIP